MLAALVFKSFCNKSKIVPGTATLCKLAIKYNPVARKIKKNFKKLSSLALSLLLIFSLSLSAFAADISAEQAKVIALADAGYRQADVAYIRAGVDYDNGVKEYDVEFLVKNADAYLAATKP